MHDCQPGQGLFYEDSPALVLQSIVRGTVKLYKTGPKREQLVIRVLGSGDLLGFRPILADEPYSASAEAIETTTICSITKETFLDILRKSAQLSLSMMRRLALELRVSEEQSLALSQLSARQRVARMLLELNSKAGRPSTDGSRIDVPLSRAEMAQMAAITPETLSRTLRNLADEHVINLTRSHIVITKVDLL